MKTKFKVLILIGAVLLIAMAIFLFIFFRNQNSLKNLPTVEKSTYEQRIVLLNEAVAIKLGEETVTNISIEGPESSPSGPNYALGIYRTKSSKTGIFLAHKVKEQWVAVWTGEKQYTCEEVKDFQFPESITGCK